MPLKNPSGKYDGEHNGEHNGEHDGETISRRRWNSNGNDGGTATKVTFGSSGLFRWLESALGSMWATFRYTLVSTQQLVCHRVWRRRQANDAAIPLLAHNNWFCHRVLANGNGIPLRSTNSFNNGNMALSPNPPHQLPAATMVERQRELVRSLEQPNTICSGRAGNGNGGEHNDGETHIGGD